MRRRNFISGSVALALKKSSLEEAAALVERATSTGEVSAAALHVHQGAFTLSRAFGRAANPDSIFLLASISKPMTATGVMLLADRGQLSLDHAVRKYIPEFSGGDRDLVTIRHLLTHTSGLPDMLPENVELRKRHAPLKDFVAGTCKTHLLFKPGTEVRYQSMGILLAAEIAERITRKPFREFLSEELFQPAEMRRTSLGLGGRKISETALCQVTDDEDWNWNSRYWRDLGSPWGGVHSTAADVAKFLFLFLTPNGRVLKPETAAAMITNQTRGLTDPRGLGWMLKPGSFGRTCSPQTYGHYGSTGTVAWADPKRSLSCVLLTTKPADQSRAGLLGPVSDMVSESAH